MFTYVYIKMFATEMRVLCMYFACMCVGAFGTGTNKTVQTFCVFCCPLVNCANLGSTAPVALVPASLPLCMAMPKTYSASQPSLQRSTGGDLRSLVDCHQQETLHCCQVTDSVHLCLLDISLGLRYLDLLWDLNPSTSDPQSKVLTTMLQGQCKNISCSLFK